MQSLSLWRRAIAHFLTPFALSILLAPAVSAQTASVAVGAVSISINPAATDSYTLQGIINGLSLAGASAVQLAVGNLPGDDPA
jgi:hypothetical protein